MAWRRLKTTVLRTGHKYESALTWKYQAKISRLSQTQIAQSSMRRYPQDNQTPTPIQKCGQYKNAAQGQVEMSYRIRVQPQSQSHQPPQKPVLCRCNLYWDRQTRA